MVKTYQINEFVFSEETRSLSHESRVTSLDPKVADLLIYFIQHQNKVITRDEILDEVWQGRVVTDNTLTWSISQLRKAFLDDATDPKLIKTIPKKGYQFIAGCQVVPEQTSSKYFVSGKKVQLLSVALIAAIALFWGLKPNIEKSYQITDITKLTVLQGEEGGGDLSEGNQYLLFRHRSPDSANFQLMIKPMFDDELIKAADHKNKLVASSRDLAPVRIVNDPFNYMDSVWGVNDRQVIAARSSVSECQIILLELSVDRTKVTSEKSLSPCDQKARVSMVFNQDSQTLFYTDIENFKHSVFSLSLADGEKKMLYSSNNPGYGVRHLSKDLGSTALLMLEDSQHSATEFVRFDLATQATSVIYRSNSIYYSAHFAPDGVNLWLNNSNDSLVHLNVTNGQVTPLTDSSFGWNYDLKPVSDSLGLMSVSNSNLNDLFIWERGKQLIRKETPYNESLPTLSPDGEQLAFISDKTGLPQIWIENLGSNKQQQLSTLSKFREFQALVWSPNGRWILGASEGELSALDLEKGELKTLYRSNTPIMFPNWDEESSRILFTQETQDGWNVYTISINQAGPTTQLKPILTGGRIARYWQGGILFSKPNQSGLFFTNNEVTRPLFSDVPMNGYWLLSQNSVTYAKMRSGTKLYTYPDPQEIPQLLLEFDGRIGPVFTYLEGKLVAKSVNRLQSDIVKVQIKSI